MADIFVSYTSGDREWAFWIGQELEKLDYVPRIHEWEISGGDDIPRWMEESLEAAERCLLVIGKAYLTKPYSSWERRAAQWAAQKSRPNFVLPVLIEACELPVSLGHLNSCDLHGLSEEQARASLAKHLKPAQRPEGPQPFPGSAPAAPSVMASSTAPIAFPGKEYALSNIPFAIPLHFLGRDDSLAAIETALKRKLVRVAITALHGLRGVGKTVLAAAYAEAHRRDYRATWWIRAQTESTMRADIVALGIRLGWVGANDQEETALAALKERLRQEGDGILLIFDNAIDAQALRPYIPFGGAAQVLVTSSAPDWRSIAEPVEIHVWPTNIGADFLVARTGRAGERSAAGALSDALGGLPLAHEQAAAYCDRLGISFAEYRRRFDAAPMRFLDDTRHTPLEHHYGLTVAKSFALAIEEAVKLNSAAEPLIVHAALLAPEPIPLFLFAEARQKLEASLATALADEGLDESIAALRTFALVDREQIMDERDPSITTDAIRLHRLVREVAAARCGDEAREELRSALAAALAAVYPDDGHSNPSAWPHCALLTPHLLAICEREVVDAAANAECSSLLNRAGAYFHGRAAYSAARPLLERALAIDEKVRGPEHPATATGLNNLASLLQDQGDFAGARPLFERALAIDEKVQGPEHSATATHLNNLATLLHTQGDLAMARPLFERVLAIRETACGHEHPDTAQSLNNLARLLHDQGDPPAARPLFERALAIHEKALGPEHPHTATSLNNLALIHYDEGDCVVARSLFERALAIREKALGPEHPATGTVLYNLASLLQDQGDLAAARALYERALAICEKALGLDHLDTATSLNNLALLVQVEGGLAAARPLYERALAIHEKALCLDHPDMATTLNNLALLLKAQGDHAAARPLFERALVIREKALGAEHPDTVIVRKKLANLPLRTE
jgi:tetratricopeptide (TPR) repeat protein